MSFSFYEDIHNRVLANQNAFTQSQANWTTHLLIALDKELNSSISQSRKWNAFIDIAIEKEGISLIHVDRCP